MEVVDRAQSIASLSTILDTTLPAEFIRPDKERPDLTTYHGPKPTLPVVDLSHHDSDHTRIVEQITRAAKEWGIFQVVNHGIPLDVVKEVQKVGKEFFELPLEEKELYAAEPGSTTVEGYGSQNLQKDAEGRKGWVDYLFHNIWPASKVNYKYWPRNPPQYRKANVEYAKYLVGVLDELLRCLSLGLGLDEGVLKEASGGDDLEFLLKINYYPPCPRPDLALGVIAHTDMSAITILVPNEVPGLQVFKDDHWVDAEYIPNALIIHIGDQIEILSNGKYKSVLHRTTVSKEKTRMSWPVFCSPPHEKIVGPLPQLVSDENPAKFKTKKYKDYQYCKLNKLPQ